MNRQVGVKALSKVLKQQKNCQTFEKYIFEQVEKAENATELYLWCIYQVVGLLIQDASEMKSIAGAVKAGRIGWKSPTYDTVSAKIEEFDEYLAKPFEVVEGVVECGKCHSKKTWSVQRQTRSQDEPMTTFSRCVECGHQWSYSG
jgi:DNA-directed RNA polymerase subunit M/transcription elongation factor TFIIS